jgi:uncharacterized membrane protein YqjE
LAATDYENLNIRELGQRLADTTSDLVEKQVLLAKQEARENLQEAIRAAIWLAAGAVLLLFAVICLLIALTTGTADLFRWPAWLAGLIWLVIFAAVGAVCLLVGRRRLRITPLGHTRATLKEDVEWARQRLKPREK